MIRNRWPANCAHSRWRRRRARKALPEVPTVSEFVPGYEASNWVGLGAPTDTPAEIINKINMEPFGHQGEVRNGSNCEVRPKAHHFRVSPDSGQLFLSLSDIYDSFILRTRRAELLATRLGYGNLVQRLVAVSIKSGGHWLEGWQQWTVLSWFRGAVCSRSHFHWADRTKMGAANCIHRSLRENF